MTGTKMGVSMSISTARISLATTAALALLTGTPALGQSAGTAIDRTVLPVPEPMRPTYQDVDARNVKAPPRFEVKAPAGAPNVVIVLIDDVGFGAPSRSAVRSPRQPSTGWPSRACATTISTPRRSARRRAPR